MGGPGHGQVLRDRAAVPAFGRRVDCPALAQDLAHGVGIGNLLHQHDVGPCRPDQLGQLAYLGIQVLASVLGAEGQAPLHVTAVQGVAIGQACRATVARPVPPAQGLAEGPPARKDSGRHQMLGIQRHDAQAIRIVDGRAAQCIVRLTACLSALGVISVVRASGYPGACPGMGVCALVLVLLSFLLAPLACGRLFTPFGRHVRTAPLGQRGLTGSPRTGAAAGIVSRTAHQTRQQGGGKQQGRKAVAHGGSGKGTRRVRRKEGANGQGRVSSRDGTGHGCGTASRVQGRLLPGAWRRFRPRA